jgi:hypothetical protein
MSTFYGGEQLVNVIRKNYTSPPITGSDVMYLVPSGHYAEIYILGYSGGGTGSPSVNISTSLGGYAPSGSITADRTVAVGSAIYEEQKTPIVLGETDSLNIGATGTNQTLSYAILIKLYKNP